MATHRLKVSDWTFTSLADPYSNDRTSPIVTLIPADRSSYGYLFLRFEELPEELWYKHIEYASCVAVYASTKLSEEWLSEALSWS